MKLGLIRRELIEALTPAMSAVSNKNTIKSIEGVLLTAEEDSAVCKISAYDMEKGVITSVPATIFSPGSYIINAQKLFQIARALEGEEVTISVNAELSVKIEGGGSSFKLIAMHGADFPALPAIQGERGFNIPRGEFRKIAARVTHAIGQNNPRPVLNNAFLNINDSSLTMAGCDGFRLAVSSGGGATDSFGIPGEGISALVPGKTISDLIRIIGDSDDLLEVLLTRKHIIFKTGETYFFSRLADGEYIDYNRVLPSERRISIIMSRETLLGIIERAALVAEDKVAGNARSHIKLKVSEGRNSGLLEVTAVSATGSVYEETAVMHEGEEIEICFNSRYLADAVRSADCETLRLIMNNPLSGLMLLPHPDEEEADAADGNNNFIFLVQPVNA